MFFPICTDDFMRHATCDLQHTYKNPELHDESVMKVKFMNWICMIGLKYDASRHIKRTCLHFVPGQKVDFSKIDPGDLIPANDLHDWTDVLVDGKRYPEKLKEYYTTKITGENIYIISIFVIINETDDKL